MKPTSFTRYEIAQVWGKSKDLASAPIHRYRTLAGAKSSLRTMQSDLRKRYMEHTWLRASSCFSTRNHKERKAIADRLRIVKVTTIQTVL